MPTRERDKRYQKTDRYRSTVAAWRETNKEKIRLQKRALQRKRLGLPEPTRPCPATCELCDGPPNGQGSLHLDHDHATGKFRGWLCYGCNSGLGKLGDDEAGLDRARAYLRRACS